jgi:DNA mismatch repair protein MutL
MKGKYPQAVVMLTCNPDSVDVNVHPAKQEVRFLNSNKVYETIVRVIGKALSPQPHVFTGPRAGAKNSWTVRDEFQGEIFEPSISYSGDEDRLSPAMMDDREQEVFPGRGKGIRIIGQLRNTYVLCELEGGFLIIDQHAAHERIVYENLKRGLAGSGIERQSLLIPYELELTLKERDVFFEKGDHLERFGFEMEHFGGNTFLLRAVPALLGNISWDSFFSEVLLRIGEKHSVQEPDFDGILSVMACHGAIRAGQSLMGEEMEHLVRQLQDMELPTNCPHGRPVFKFFSFYEIEKMFKRVL